MYDGLVGFLVGILIEHESMCVRISLDSGYQQKHNEETADNYKFIWKTHQEE